jgi:hypothetical protein
VKHTHAIVGFLGLVCTVIGQALSAPGDFASLREAADALARQERAGFQLLKVDYASSGNCCSHCISR